MSHLLQVSYTVLGGGPVLHTFMTSQALWVSTSAAQNIHQPPVKSMRSAPVHGRDSPQRSPRDHFQHATKQSVVPQPLDVTVVDPTVANDDTIASDVVAASECYSDDDDGGGGTAPNKIGNDCNAKPSTILVRTSNSFAVMPTVNAAVQRHLVARLQAARLISKLPPLSVPS